MSEIKNLPGSNMRKRPGTTYDGAASEPGRSRRHPNAALTTRMSSGWLPERVSNGVDRQIDICTGIRRDHADPSLPCYGGRRCSLGEGRAGIHVSARHAEKGGEPLDNALLDVARHWRCSGMQQV